MLKKNTLLLMALTLSLLLLFTGCSVVSTSDSAPPASKKESSSSGEESDEDKYKFAVVPAGVHPFFEPMEGAAAQAAKDFGLPEVTYQSPQNWVQVDQNVVLDGLVAKGYTGIAMFPSDPVAANDEITKIVNENIPVIAVGGSPEEPTDTLFTLATDVYGSAYEATQHLIKSMGEEGKIVHLTGLITDANTKKRIEAVEKAVSEYPNVELLQTISDIDAAEPAQNAISSLLAARRSEIDGIVATAYVPSATVARQFRQLDEKRIKAILIDTDQSVFDGIRDGYIEGTMSQNPHGMAYIAMYSLKLLADGYTWKDDAPYFVDSGTFLVNKENIDRYDELVNDVTEGILSDWESKYFNAPN
ncbi:substrate-binding domain-containing protein [bacterium LRH843]|nr:substrate-binding domain-containing protein [bacterium LRH843]